jgi:hypothetical protein
MISVMHSHKSSLVLKKVFLSAHLTPQCVLTFGPGPVSLLAISRVVVRLLLIAMFGRIALAILSDSSSFDV